MSNGCGGVTANTASNSVPLHFKKWYLQEGSKSGRTPPGKVVASVDAVDDLDYRRFHASRYHPNALLKEVVKKIVCLKE